MDLRKVLFIGGDPVKLASVQIRCLDIADRLGCDCLLNVRSVDAIPKCYSVFVCVKPSFGKTELAKLTKKGQVVWDIIDNLPPAEGVALYLASTNTVKQDFSHLGQVKVIRHHHCNMNSRPNPLKVRRPAWIGSREWLPSIAGVDFDRYFIQGMTQKDVIRAHRKVGIGLNFRGSNQWIHPKHPAKLQFDIHVAMNSGIKLINCIGFGTPSVSADEPAYREIGDGCTIFCDIEEVPRWVGELQKNARLYSDLRRKCLRLAKNFNIETIVTEYRNMLHAI